MWYRSVALFSMGLLAAFCFGQDGTESNPVEVKRVEYRLDRRPHTSSVDTTRLTTNRDSPVRLPVPEEEDMFTFAVFGDRTGGPPEGIEILRQAVADTNLFEPDLVMTVGDLIQGYNETDEWMVQMREYRESMKKLLCPWFPVAGNHDVYYRGPNPPTGEHDRNYEMHFGPLWYAFEHKNCWFIVLYSDEGNPVTGEKNFNKPECQRMSKEQFAWLRETLEKSRSADHVFLFLHHPRWLGNNYGNDWDRIHAELKKNGNVRIVFGGHIHRMRYDPKDDIEYVTLATVGGGQSGVSARAGYLHHYVMVTVRKQQIALASIPVGEVSDVREVTGALSDEVLALASTAPRFENRPRFDAAGKSSTPTEVRFTNPTSRPVEYTVRVESPDPRWACRPDHLHLQVGPNQSATRKLGLIHFEKGVDESYRAPELVVETDYLAESTRISLTERRFSIPVRVDIPRTVSGKHRAVKTGDGNCLRVESGLINLPQGPMTLECWMKANSFGKSDRIDRQDGKLRLRDLRVGRSAVFHHLP